MGASRSFTIATLVDRYLAYIDGRLRLFFIRNRKSNSTASG